MLDISNPIVNYPLFAESYDAIRESNEIEVVNGQEKEAVFQETLRSIRTPNETKKFWFENLFKVNKKVNHVNLYIARRVIDFGYVRTGREFYPNMVNYHVCAPFKNY